MDNTPFRERIVVKTLERQWDEIGQADVLADHDPQILD